MPSSRDPSRLPVRRDDETHQAFLDRCMSDPVMETDYPEPAQRAALCLHQSGMKPKVGGQRGHSEMAKLPERRPDETPGVFQTRCMADPSMIEAFPDLKERLAACYRRSGENPKVGGESAQDIEQELPCKIRMSGSVTIWQD